MEPRFLLSPDESRTERLASGEPVLPFVLVVLIVAQGAQAELAALFARLVPTTAPVAYIVVSAPDEPGTTSELAAALPTSPLLCDIVHDGDRLRVGQVYIIPHRSSARVHDGNIMLKPLSDDDDYVQGTNALLSSIACLDICTAIMVYLGNSKPMAFAAVSRIREAGGFALHAIAADRFEEPDAVGQTVVYDSVLPAEALPAELGRLVDGIDPLQRSPVSEASYLAVQPILTLLRTHLGYDLQGYCLDTISRRIGRRMLLRMKDISTYYALLQSSSTELQKLGADILMPFTHFFRNASSWARLSEVALPRMFEQGADRITRIWSAGCSTGEEAYSLAMLLIEYQERTNLPLSFVIFGTDINTSSLLRARAGLYSHTIDQELSPERLKRFFCREEGGYRVIKEVRDLCVFSDHNLCFDTPISDIDLLLCRHTLRYFDRTLREQAIANILHAVTPEGICMLDEADVTGSLEDRLTPLDAGHHLYSKGHPTMNNTKPRMQQQISPEPIVQATTSWGALSVLNGPVALQRFADSLVSARFGPPGLIVDSALTVVEIRGDLGPFVQISAGLASSKLQQLIKPALAGKIVELVQAASSGSRPLVANCVLPPSGQSVTIEVLPLPMDSPWNPFFLVLLQLNPGSHERPGDDAAPSAASRTAIDAGFESVTRHDSSVTDVSPITDIPYRRQGQPQRHTVEGSRAPSLTGFGDSPEPQHKPWPHDAHAEALGKRPAQQDLRQKEAKNVVYGSDAQVEGLVASIDVPLILLSREFIIRLLSPSAAAIMGLSAEDVGKMLTSLDLHLNDLGQVEPLLVDVLHTLRPYVREVQDRHQHWYRIVVRPHQVATEAVGLIVMFVDIDTERTLRHQLIQARDFATCVLQQIPLPLAVLHADLTFRSANAAFQSLTGTADQTLPGWSLQNFTQRFWGVSADAIELHKLELLPIGGLIETEFSTRSAPGQTLLLKGQALLNGSARVLLLVVEDVTLRRETDRVLARQQTALADQLENRDTLLKVTQKELHDLAQHLFTVQEQERERIASELHDDVSQRLSLLQMACNRLSQLDHSPPETLEINSILQQVQSLASDVRVMSHNLHPALLKQLGLVVALKSLVDDFREKENLPATLTSTIGALHPSDLASTTCYRVVQEALRNVAKHAGRTHVKVSLDAVEGRLRLQIRDFGNGFDQDSHFPQAGLGLTSMRERTRIAGGTFSVVSTLGEGTVIVAEVPAGVDG